MNKKNNNVFKIVAIALFIAIAYISSLILPIKVQFLTMDVKDAFITIGALYFGPLSGVVMSVAVSLLELIFGSDTGAYGFIMNFIGSAAFCAVACMTTVMLAANLVITPLFMASKGMTAQAIEEMIVPLLLPFNLFKGILNAAIVMLLYKPVSVALKNTRLSTNMEAKAKLNKNTVIVSVIAILIMVLSLLFIFAKLGGVFTIVS